MADTHQNYIAGDWVAGTGIIENRNPSDITDLIGHYAQASTAQVDQALDAARRAQAEWAAYGLERKQNVLNAIGTEMMARAEELGALLSREEGKPLAEGKGEVHRASNRLSHPSDAAPRQRNR